MHSAQKLTMGMIQRALQAKLVQLILQPILKPDLPSKPTLRMLSACPIACSLLAFLLTYQAKITFSGMNMNKKKNVNSLLREFLA